MFLRLRWFFQQFCGSQHSSGSVFWYTDTDSCLKMIFSKGYDFSFSTGKFKFYHIVKIRIHQCRSIFSSRYYVTLRLHVLKIFFWGGKIINCTGTYSRRIQIWIHIILKLRPHICSKTIQIRNTGYTWWYDCEGN